MKLLSVVTMMTVLAAHSAFGNKLHFENVEVSSGASTDIRMRGSFRDRLCPPLCWEPGGPLHTVDLTRPTNLSLLPESSSFDLSLTPPPRPIPLEEGTCCFRLSWWAVSYQPSGSTGPWRLPPPTIVRLQRIVYSSNQLIKNFTLTPTFVFVLLLHEGEH